MLIILSYSPITHEKWTILNEILLNVNNLAQLLLLTSQKKIIGPLHFIEPRFCSHYLISIFYS